jgi:hypothetical protein
MGRASLRENMKHYKDENNTIHAFESDGSQDAFIKPTMGLLSNAELAVLRAPTPERIAAQAITQANIEAKAEAMADATVQYLTSHTAAEIATYLSTRLPSLTTPERVIIARLAAAVGVALR